MTLIRELYDVVQALFFALHIWRAFCASVLPVAHVEDAAGQILQIGPEDHDTVMRLLGECTPATNWRLSVFFATVMVIKALAQSWGRDSLVRRFFLEAGAMLALQGCVMCARTYMIACTLGRRPFGYEGGWLVLGLENTLDPAQQLAWTLLAVLVCNTVASRPLERAIERVTTSLWFRRALPVCLETLAFTVGVWQLSQLLYYPHVTISGPTGAPFAFDLFQGRHFGDNVHWIAFALAFGFCKAIFQHTFNEARARSRWFGLFCEYACCLAIQLGLALHPEMMVKFPTGSFDAGPGVLAIVKPMHAEVDALLLVALAAVTAASGVFLQLAQIIFEAIRAR